MHTFETIFPSMSAGAVYVIEDLHASYWPSYGGGVDPPARQRSDSYEISWAMGRPMIGRLLRRPDFGIGPTPRYPEVASVAVHPGIALVEHSWTDRSRRVPTLRQVRSCSVGSCAVCAVRRTARSLDHDRQRMERLARIGAVSAARVGQTRGVLGRWPGRRCGRGRRTRGTWHASP